MDREEKRKSDLKARQVKVHSKRERVIEFPCVRAAICVLKEKK